MGVTHFDSAVEIVGDFPYSGAGVVQDTWAPATTTLGLMNGTTSAAGKLVVPSQGLNIRSAGDLATIGSISNTGAFVFAAGVTITAGGLTITAGGLTLSAGTASFTNTKTVASAAGANLIGTAFAATTITLTGTTQVTAAQGFVNIAQSTLTDSSAVTVDTYASLYIANAPTVGGSVTLTSAYALWVDAGNARFDGNIACGGSVLSSSASLGIGYSTGAGSASTQSTSKSTTVVSAPNPSVSGTITMNNAALNAGVVVAFTFTNSAIAATDTLILNHKSGGTVGAYMFQASCGAGSAVITVTNISAGNLSEAPVIAWSLVKAVTS